MHLSPRSTGSITFAAAQLTVIGDKCSGCPTSCTVPLQKLTRQQVGSILSVGLSPDSISRRRGDYFGTIAHSLNFKFLKAYMPLSLFH
jgi:hypothetical protein